MTLAGFGEVRWRRGIARNIVTATVRSLKGRFMTVMDQGGTAGQPTAIITLIYSNDTSDLQLDIRNGHLIGRKTDEIRRRERRFCGIIST
jgi:hypothetical protein